VFSRDEQLAFICRVLKNFSSTPKATQTAYQFNDLEKDAIRLLLLYAIDQGHLLALAVARGGLTETDEMYGIETRLHGETRALELLEQRGGLPKSQARLDAAIAHLGRDIDDS